MRGKSGAILGPDGRVVVGDVSIADERVTNLRELLADLSRPRLCLVLGAGASYGVIPISAKEIAALLWERLQAQASAHPLPIIRSQPLEHHPELIAVTELLIKFPPDAWDRMLNDLPLPWLQMSWINRLSPTRATTLLNDVFTPRSPVPDTLIRIYDVLENNEGSIVCYNYDRIVEQQSRFPVITPHGQRPKQLERLV